MRRRTPGANRLLSLPTTGFPLSLSAHKLAGLFLCLIPLLCWIAVSEAKIIERILVVVNDDIITKTELEDRLEKEKEMRQMFYQYDEARLSEEMEKARPEILDAMISELLFLQEAVKKGVKVPDSEIQQFVNSLKKQYDSPEAFREALKAEGYTEYTFVKERKRSVLRQKLIEQEFGSELDVSDEEVKQFYRENRDKFPSKADAVKLKHIFIRFQTTEADREEARKRAADILKRCREGADFAEMATDFSDHEPTKSLGGDMGYFYPGMGQYDPVLEKAASQLAVGEISDLIETPAGYDIIKITDTRDNAVRARRIYVAIRPDHETERQADNEASLVLEELKKGADFVELAKKYSDDPQAVEKEGDWKEISIDLMAPELRRAFQSFDVGQVSQPVKTPLGIHILKIVARQELANDEMEQLRAFLQDKRLQEKIEEYAAKLKERSLITILAEN